MSNLKELDGLKKDIKLNQAEVIEKFGNYVVKNLAKNISIIKVPCQKLFKGKIKEDAVLLLSDIHVGKVNEYWDSDLRKNVTTYNTEICKKECGRLIYSVNEISNLLSQTYDINKLWIVVVGDICENQFIYPGQQMFIDSDVGTQVLTTAQIFKDIITELLKIFKEIEVVTVPGNHGRITARPEANPASATFDFICLKIVEIMFSNNKNVKFQIVENYYNTLKIMNWKYYMHHGNGIYSALSLPYYGIVRQSKSRRIEIDYDVELIGHFHQRLEIPVGSRSYTLVNASWIKYDCLGWSKYGNLSKPEQYFFGVGPKRPRTWSFNLDLTI